MNEFAIMSNNVSQSQLHHQQQMSGGSDGTPERGALSRGIVEPRNSGLHPPEPARVRRNRGNPMNKINTAYASQKNLYNVVKGALLNSSLHTPKSALITSLSYSSEFSYR